MRNLIIFVFVILIIVPSIRQDYSFYKKIKSIRYQLIIIRKHDNYRHMKIDDYNTLVATNRWLYDYQCSNFLEFLKKYNLPNPLTLERITRELLYIRNNLDSVKRKKIPLYDKSGRIKGFVRLKQQPKGA